MAKDTGRFAGVAFQEAEDTGRPQPLSIHERKRMGAELTRIARDEGVGGSFTVPKGLDLEGANKWYDAAIKSIRARNQTADEVLKEKRRNATTVPEGY
tara:strand:+ start:185 stop:478 length:294 start_codon:yes stop_codon:yes gene_type:complete